MGNNGQSNFELIQGGGEGESRLERARRRVREAYRGSTYGDHLQAVPSLPPEHVEAPEPLVAEGEVVTGQRQMAQDARQKIAQIYAVEQPGPETPQLPGA